ncbi:hypothetical protein PGT21_020738 [Puccinia graminis f. sp. tritici]|uniref:Uncharacterized protein n=2 Tax=Puccinia graminis f. sp. tritici TaxID=56615 RepID=E3KFF4_PUCGT|nr:uncharacterized protein PGTG_09949 [Puccinia graminis f. sp. tritici CRL 75-36-700-3]EFP82981.1 hypothetical protein PGTG_09949 [Puccinia graminis f. sp. tritici CRL 75-36-700-3]KAA1068570.1 hypothetical protein PGTUg99_031847 [Puccinia graminis f. sp. tritici]KAA1069380.1 hypothetical protein PGT21_022767 [Puccinia graminis f. sp. tritici]KAA1104360.1 hypothetical protein PGT21_020738 [Puccinia graminis f. sp. tritici]
MAFLRELMSILMVSIWVGTVMSATTTATNALDVSQKGAAGLPPSSMADAVAQSLAANPGELSGACRQTLAGFAKDEALAVCTNLHQMVQIRTSKDSISAPIKAWMKGMCAAPACVPASLTSAGEQFKTGCAAEMQSGSMDAAAFYSILTTYQTIRTDGCPNLEKLDLCDQTLAGHIKKWTKKERPFFSVQKAAYCMECGPKIANQPSPETKSGKNSTKHPLCRGTASGSNTVDGLLGKPIVIALPAPNGSAKPTKPAKSS